MWLSDEMWLYVVDHHFHNISKHLITTQKTHHISTDSRYITTISSADLGFHVDWLPLAMAAMAAWKLQDWSEWFLLPFNVLATLAILLSNFECSWATSVQRAPPVELEYDKVIQFEDCTVPGHFPGPRSFPSPKWVSLVWPQLWFLDAC